MARTDEQTDALTKLRYEAEAALLKNIAEDEYNAPTVRDYAEAYALLTGKLTVKNG